MSRFFTSAAVLEDLCRVTPDSSEAVDRVRLTAELLSQMHGADAEGAERLRHEVVLLNIDLAESIALRYSNRGVPTEDLVQVACLGLVKAATGFDPDKGDNFFGYAVPTISGEVKRFFRDNAWVVRPARRIQELQAEISSTSKRLLQERGRFPTPHAVARELGTDAKEVIEALAARGCFAASSLDRWGGSSSCTASSLADALGNDDPGFSSAEARVVIEPLCRRLCDRDRRVLYLRFFREWTQKRIAKELGMTEMQVSRLIARILADMRGNYPVSNGPVAYA